MRHHHVGRQQIDWVGMAAGDFQGFISVPGLQHRITAVVQYSSNQIAECKFVFDQQDRLLALQHDLIAEWRIRGAGHFVDYWQIDPEDGTPVWFACRLRYVRLIV